MAPPQSFSGYPFVLHDLRRTFLSRGERLGFSHFMLRRLANHSFGGDVTAGYIVFDIEHLRQPVQRITDEFLMLMGCHKYGFMAAGDDVYSEA